MEPFSLRARPDVSASDVCGASGAPESDHTMTATTVTTSVTPVDAQAHRLGRLTVCDTLITVRANCPLCQAFGVSGHRLVTQAAHFARFLPVPPRARGMP